MEAVNQLAQLIGRVARKFRVIATVDEQISVRFDRREMRNVPVMGAREVNAELEFRLARTVMKLLNDVALGASLRG